MADKPVVLITGCSSGLGCLLVRRYLELGYIVYATVRDASKLGGLSIHVGEPSLNIHELDVCNDCAVEQLVALIESRERRIDVMVANAGSHISEPIETVSPDRVERVFNSNFFGALHCIQSVAPLMRKQKSGSIIAISSLSAQVGLPCDGIYSASKAALERVLESLRAELSPFLINVHAVIPASFPSKLLQQAQCQSLDKSSPYYPLLAHCQNEFAALPGGTVELVADTVISLIAEGAGAGAGFRVAADPTAELVLKQIYRMGDEARSAAIDQWSGAAWWRDYKA